jgi:hypothetical protein
MLRSRPEKQEILHRHIKIVVWWEERSRCFGTFFFGVQEHRHFPSAPKDYMQETRQAYPDSLEVGLWSTLRVSIIFFTKQTRRDRQSSWITEFPSLCSSPESIWPGSAIGKDLGKHVARERQKMSRRVPSRTKTSRKEKEGFPSELVLGRGDRNVISTTLG